MELEIGWGKQSKRIILSSYTWLNIFRDELLYDAKIHPEQYSNTLSNAQIAQLHKSINYVCKLAVDALADKSQFPDHWLFNHRWGKGKKDSSTTLPNGQKFVYLTVGGRTSCVVPSVQKKTGPVTGDVKKEASDDEETTVKSAKGRKTPKKATKKAKVEDDEESSGPADDPEEKKAARGKKRTAAQANGVSSTGIEGADGSEEAPTASKKRKAPKKDSGKSSHDKPNGVASELQSEPSGRRRSARVSGKGN